MKLFVSYIEVGGRNKNIGNAVVGITGERITEEAIREIEKELQSANKSKQVVLLNVQKIYE